MQCIYGDGAIELLLLCTEERLGACSELFIPAVSAPERTLHNRVHTHLQFDFDLFLLMCANVAFNGNRWSTHFSTNSIQPGFDKS